MQHLSRVSVAQGLVLPTTEPRWRGKLRMLVAIAAVSVQPPPLSPTTASVTT